MYKLPHYRRTLITVNNTKEGETIELKVRRLIDNKEPIKDGSPLLYTERKLGVDPAYNIRTDRFEIATDLMDKVNKSKQAKRDNLLKSEETNNPDTIVKNIKDGKPESTASKPDKNESK